jgi:hypothetical protein
VADFPERQRIRPTVEGRARLLGAIEAVSPPHVVDSGTLGEYAELVVVRGQAEADARLPAVATHLAEGCPGCADDLRELIALAGAPEPGSSPGPPPAADLASDEREPGDAGSPPTSPADSMVGRRRDPTGSALDSGIHVTDLPDPRAAEALGAAEAARLQRLRRLRDWLLIAAAISILFIGISLVGLAYLAQNAPGPARLGLTPLPAATPAPGGAGRASPSGMTCPASHPIKGNRSSMIYHRPGAEFYEQTRPEDCFASPADAEAAGYRASQR